MRRRAVSSRPQTESFLLGLAPGGGYLAIRITADAGGLLHHLFTITSRLSVRGCLFLWPSSGRLTPNGVFPPRVLPDAMPYGVRTFLDSANAEPRSPDQPEAVSSYPHEGGTSTRGGVDSLHVRRLQKQSPASECIRGFSSKIGGLSIFPFSRSLREQVAW